MAGWFDDPINQKQFGYLFCLFACWVSCCVVFGGELHRAEINRTEETQITATTFQVSRTTGTYYMKYDGFAGSVTVESYTRSNSGNSAPSTFSSSGTTNYKQCTVDLCDRCYSGGAGAVAMAVFAWLAYLTAFVLRGLVIWEKNQNVPVIGGDDAKYAFVELIVNYTALGFFVLMIVAWAGGCMAGTASSSGVDKVVPTGLVFIVLCLAAAIGGIVLLKKVHDESGFAGGTAKKSNPAAPAAAPAATTAPASGGANAV